VKHIGVQLGVLARERLSTPRALLDAASERVSVTEASLLDAWHRVANGWLLLQMLMVLLLAVGLAALIAYHPTSRRRISSLEHLDQPKTILMYGVVAAVVAVIVEVQPAMAFVIFGIGGLLRFRTLVGDAKETGRVILVTVVGLCCGLKIFSVAIAATIVGWLLILFLERDVVGTIRVVGVPESTIQEASRAYRTLITNANVVVVGEQANVVKREFAFVVKAKAPIDHQTLQMRFDSLHENLRGLVVWERV